MGVGDRPPESRARARDGVILLTGARLREVDSFELRPREGDFLRFPSPPPPLLLPRLRDGDSRDRPFWTNPDADDEVSLSTSFFPFVSVFLDIEFRFRKNGDTFLAGLDAIFREDDDVRDALGVETAEDVLGESEGFVTLSAISEDNCILGSWAFAPEFTRDD